MFRAGAVFTRGEHGRFGGPGPRGSVLLVTTPSPAQLRAYAEELRELATAQATRAGSCETLLDAVTKLDNDHTWQGPYVTTTHATITSWSSQLTTAAQDCRTQAASWRRLATELDDKADTAAAKASTAGGGS